MQIDGFDQILARAVAERAPLPGVATGATDAFRLVDGCGDGAPGIYIDTYAGHWLVQTREVPFPVLLRHALPEACAAVWWKELTNADSRRDSPKWIAGSDRTDIVVIENGVRLAIDFASGYSQGIFLDQRNNREWLRQHCSSGHRVLNLFAYTCAFSVAAGLAGACTTSVDLSMNYLEWGKRNFSLNGIRCDGTERHRFYNWDAIDFLKMASRKSERYSFIVCDPPTFSRNKHGRVFRVERDYAALISRCTEVLEPGGVIMCSTNHRALSQGQFNEMARSGVAQAGRAVDGLTINDMPVDFTGEPYLKSIRLRVV